MNLEGMVNYIIDNSSYGISSLSELASHMSPHYNENEVFELYKEERDGCCEDDYTEEYLFDVIHSDSAHQISVFIAGATYGSPPIISAERR